MGTRRNAREAALQFLFQDDFLEIDGLGGIDELEQRFDRFSTLYQVNRKARPYAFKLLSGIAEKMEQIDAKIREHALNWRLERIAGTDRNLLRIGIFELLFADDVPAQVAINEAVEIAKRFGTEDSPSFINGVLDAVQQSRQENTTGSPG